MMNMDIISLTGVMSYRKINSYGRFQDTKTKGDNNYFKLFKAIKNGKVLNDSQAQEYLGIEKKATYSRFKGRYVDKLLIHLESSHLLGFQGPILDYELFVLYSKGKRLKSLSDKHNAIVIFKIVLNKAIKIGDMQIALGAAIELRTSYGYVLPDRKKYLFYENLVVKYKKKYLEYDDLMEGYTKICHYFFTKKSNKEFELVAIDVLFKLEAIDHNEHLHMYKIRYWEQLIFLYTYFNKFIKAEKVAKVALEYIRTFKYCIKLDKYIILNEVGNLHMKKRNFSAVLRLFRESNSLKTRERNTLPSLMLYGLEFMVNAHLMEYSKLFKITYDVFKGGNIEGFKNLFQTWKIREAYCNLLFFAEKIDPEIA